MRSRGSCRSEHPDIPLRRINSGVATARWETASSPSHSGSTAPFGTDVATAKAMVYSPPGLFAHPLATALRRVLAAWGHHPLPQRERGTCQSHLAFSSQKKTVVDTSSRAAEDPNFHSRRSQRSTDQCPERSSTSRGAGPTTPLQTIGGCPCSRRRPSLRSQMGKIVKNEGWQYGVVKLGIQNGLEGRVRKGKIKRVLEGNFAWGRIKISKIKALCHVFASASVPSIAYLLLASHLLRPTFVFGSCP